jgi:hypothetical protein
VVRLKYVDKLAEALLGSGTHVVMLERFCCSRQGDVRPIGGEVSDRFQLRTQDWQHNDGALVWAHAGRNREGTYDRLHDV